MHSAKAGTQPASQEFILKYTRAKHAVGWLVEEILSRGTLIQGTKCSPKNVNQIGNFKKYTNNKTVPENVQRLTFF